MLFIRRLAELFLKSQAQAKGQPKLRRKKRSVIQSQFIACASIPSSESLEERSLLSATFTGITPDNGDSSTDNITNTANVTLQGTNTPNVSLTINQTANPAGTFGSPQQVAFLNGAAVSGSTFSLGVELTDGDGTYSFEAFQSGQMTPTTITLTIDTVAPTVSLTAPTLTNDNTPQVSVDASDAFTGVTDGTSAFLDIDLNDDNDFLDAGEAGYAVGTVNSGKATFSPTTPLNDGTYKARARVLDKAGNTGTSANSTIEVDATPPTITAGNISTTGATGTGGAFRVGDTVTVSWDTSGAGDNNTDITSVSIDFTSFGGGVQTPTESSGVYTAKYVIIEGSIDTTTAHASVTATDKATNVTTTNDTNVTVDSDSPTVSDANISVSGATGTAGTFKIGDTVTVSWNNTAGGDNNADIAGVTANFTAFGGGAAVAASNSSNTWTATYVITSGTIDTTNLNVSVTATDDAGNSTTAGDTTNSSADNQAPAVTDGKISITSTPTGTGSTYKVGDTITVEWDNSASGDNNADISSVTVNFSAFGGGAAVAATQASGKWSASFTVVEGSVDATGLNASITVTDDAGNVTTQGDTTGLSVDSDSPTVTDANITITSSPSGDNSTYVPGDTITVQWDSSATGDNNTDTLASVTVNFSAFGAVALVTASEAAGIYTASYEVLSGTIDATGLNVSVAATDNAGNKTTTADSTGLSLDNQAPTVTDGNISISGATGTGGAFKIGDTVTATWNSTAAGDNNSDLTGVTVNFTGFGGGAAVAATNSSGTWTAKYVVASGAIDTTNVNVSVTATDDAGLQTTKADSTNATVDSEAPTVTDGNISVTSTGTGTGGVSKIGDTITVSWDNSGSGEANTDTIGSVTVNFSAFGGGAAVAATEAGNVWTAIYTVTSGSIDTTGLNASVTVFDNAGNSATAADTTGLTVDNQLLTVSDAKISVTSTGSGPGGVYNVGDTITVEWDNTAGTGDNNSDTISSVTFNLSAFGGGAAVAGTNNSDKWTASYVVTEGMIDAASLNASVTATDNAGNVTTTADTTNLSVDGQSPTVTAANISISGATGTSGTYKVGDTVTVAWNNTSGGDNNADIATVTVDFTAFGGGAAVAATNSSNTWTATYVITSGSVDGTSLNVSVTATDDGGNATTTADNANATVDNELLTVTAANISVTSTGSGTSGEYIVGNTITVEWDNSASGDNNTDTASGVTIDFSAFGGGSAVTATNTAGVWSASYTVTSGTLDASGLFAKVSATDNAGNLTTTTDDDSVSVDSEEPTVSDANISVTSTGSGTGGTYIVGDTITVQWDNTASGDDNGDIDTVTVNFTSVGGGAAVAATNSSGKWSASYTVTAGTLDATGLNVSVTATDDAGQDTTTADTTGLSVDSEEPTVTDANISISGATGIGGTYKIGDTVTVTWNNTSATGDDNADIATVTVNFTQFGGGAAVAASNSSDTWTATYVIAAGTIDTTNRNVSITATDDAGQDTTTADTTNASVDNKRSTVSDGAITATTSGSGTAGVFISGDTITVEWDNSGTGDNGFDPITAVTIDFSAFGGGSTVAASNTGDKWTASYTLQVGTIDANNLNASVTATDNAGNQTTTADTSNLSIDTVIPVVTDAKISVSGATGLGGAFKIGDTVTVTWDSSAAGDNNSDLTSVTVDFTEFGGPAATAASHTGFIYTAKYVVVSGSLDTTGVDVSVTATDESGQDATTPDTTNSSLDNEPLTVTAANISVTSTGSGTGGTYVVGNTITVEWDNSASGDNNTDTVNGVTIDFSAFGGGSAVTASNTAGVWSASYTVLAGSIDASGLFAKVSATDNAGNLTTTTDDDSVSVDSEEPTVSDANISVTSTGSGTGGTFIVGDTITVQWDNTASGDDNGDIDTVTVNFTSVGGGAAVAATNSSGKWSASYVVTSGSIDATGLNVSVTATDDAGQDTTTADTTGLSVDSEVPTVTDANISISGASGTGGAYKIGDTVTATWNNTAGGDNNTDTISGVTVNFTQFGGGAAIAATNTAGTWTATYVITAGAIDGTNRNVSVTATDNSGQFTTTADTTNATVDNVAPTVTDGNISVTSTGSGPGGVYNVGDTITVEWNNTAGGDNNSDTISSVTFNLSAFGGGAAVAGTNNSGTWSASYVVTEGVIDASSLNASVTATDDAGNATTTGDTTGLSVDAQSPTVTAANISISGATGTSGAYKVGDTVTVTWNNTSATGDDNADIATVTIDFTAFGGGAAVAASNSSDTWTATYVITSGMVDGTSLNVSVTATDDGGNVTTTADDANATVDNEPLTVTAGNISVTSSGSGTGGEYIAGDTITVEWDNTAAGDNNADIVSGVTIDFSAFGGGSAVTATNSSGVWSASYTVLAGSIDASGLFAKVSATDNAGNLTTTTDDDSVSVDSEEPTVSDANISVTSTGSGTGGTYIVGDTITVQWDNTASGDDNGDIDTVTVDFTAVGGGAAVAATNAAGKWSASYVVTSGSIDATGLNVSVTATDDAGQDTTTADTTGLSVDSEVPTVTDANISISGASGTGGAYKIGDTVTATWNNTAGGDNNTDTISGVTVNFTQFGGGAAIAATNTAGTWTATYVITAGAIDGTNRNVSVTATDNSGQFTTTADTTNATVDNIAPTVTDGKISITSTGSGPGGVYNVGDTITVEWDNTAGTGDNNSDTISSVTFNLSAFGGGAAVAGTNNSDKWTASYVVTEGMIDAASLNASVTATDNAGNVTTTADTTNLSVDGESPTVTAANISISGATGTSGAYKVGDTVTVTWNNTSATGDDNADIATVTIDFTAFGGGAAVAASNSSDTWTATYVITSGMVDGTNLNVSVTATDDGGNVTTTADDANATVDNEPLDVTAGNISVTSTGSGTGGEYLAGDTITVEWDNTAAGDNNADTVSGVTIDFSAFGGGSAVTATNTAGVWSASYTVTSGTLDASGLFAKVSATDNAGNLTTTTDDDSVSVDSEEPTVSDANISVTSTGSGTGGTYIVGDTITVQWDNTAAGDDNGDIDTVTVNFTAVGGGAAVAATNAAGKWSASYVVTSGSIDATGLNVSVTATDDAGQDTTTADTTGLSVDSEVPTVTDANISISGASGSGGAYKIGDTVTATWNNTAGGDNNTDTISGVTVNFTQFGGGAAIAATNTSGTWTATYVITAGAIDGTNRNVSVTATDNSGQFTTTADTTNATVDNIAPTVTDGNISVTSTGSGPGGIYNVGDTITVEWDNTAGGDNNSDTISSVTFNLSAFGGGAAVAGTNNSDKWTASYVVTEGMIDAASLNASVTATDNAGNVTTTADTTNLSVDGQSPTVTAANISISGATGTSGAYKVGDTVTVTWNNTSATGDDNADIATVTIDFTAFGGGAAVAASNSSDTWTATYVITSGMVDGTNLNVSVTATDDGGNVTTTADDANATVDNEPLDVTAANITVTTAGSGTGGTYVVGDTITVQWDNSASGDNNSDTISSVTIDFSAFGGGASVTATNNSGIWSASYTVLAGSIDATNLNAKVSATDNAGNLTTTTDDANLSEDAQAPTVTDANISVIGTGSGVGGKYVVGDTITVQWDNTGSGDKNADIDSVSIDFSAFGGGSAVAATNSSGKWSASYVIIAGTIDASNLNASVTAIDDAGYDITQGDTTNLSVDNKAPVVTAGNISVTGATGTGGAFKAGDTVTVTWDNSSSGDNNDDITGVTFDLSGFGDSATTAATSSSDVWSYSFVFSAGSVDNTGFQVSVSASDDVGNTTTTPDNLTFTADNQLPVVTITSSPDFTQDSTPDIQVTVTDGGVNVVDGTTVSIDVDLNDDDDYDDAGELNYASGTTTSGVATITLSTLADNYYGVRARAADDVGNTDSDEVDLVVDTTAPDVTINGAPIVSIDEGGKVSLTTKVTDLTKVTYSWTITTPSTNSGTTGSTFDFTAGDDGTYKAEVTVTDEAGNQTVEFVNITVDNVAPTAVNDPGVGSEAKYTTGENTPLTVVVGDGVLANDTDPAGVNDPLSVSAVDGALMGKTSVTIETGNGATVVMNADGSFTYDSTNAFVVQALGAGETLVDTFEYEVDDGDGDTDTATVSITVTGVNDAPQIIDATGNPVIANNSIVTLSDLDANDGTGTAGDLIESFFGSRIFDMDASSVTGIVIVSATTGATGGTWEYQLAGSSTWTAFGAVSSANALHLDGGARIRVKLPSGGGSAGTPSFTWRAWDQTNSPTVASGGRANVTAIGTGGITPYSSFSAVGRVAITAATNDAPTTIGSIANQTTAEDSAFNLTVTASTLFADQDAGDSITLSATLAGGAALPSWLHFDGITGTFSGTPNDADVGTIQVRVTGTDNGGLSSSATFLLTVTAVNDAPINTVPGTVTIAEDSTAVAITGLSISDSDAGTATVSVTISVTDGKLSLSSSVSNGLTSGQISGNNSGTVIITAPISKINTTLAAATGLTFTPSHNFNGDVTLDITTNDLGNTGAGSPLSDTDSLTITVTAVNDAVVEDQGIPDQQIDELVVFNLSVPSDAFDDVDGDTLTYAATLANGQPLPAWLSFASGTFSGTPGYDDVGTISVKVTATDAGNQTATTEFDITVNQVLVNVSLNLTNVQNDVAVKVVGGNLVIQNSANTDLITPVRASRVISVTITGGTDSDTITIDSSVNGTLTNAQLIPFILNGGAGNDSLNASATIYRVQLNGDADNDTLAGGSGSDSMTGGSGDDVAVSSGDANFTITDSTIIGAGSDSIAGIEIASVIGGNSSNKLDASAATIAVSLNGGAGNDSLLGGSNNDTLFGSAGDDTLRGGAGNDSLVGLAGNDLFEGGDGNDTLSGGVDTDRFELNTSLNVAFSNSQVLVKSGSSIVDMDIISSIEQATLNLSAGRNLVDGSAFTGLGATILGGGGTDAIIGTQGDDYIQTGSGNDVLSGLAGNDSIYAGGGNDAILGGDGNDALVGGLGNDSIDGGAGIDGIIGNDGADLLNGGTGNDLVQGGGGVNQIFGGDGNDLLIGGNDVDTIEGELGDDRIFGFNGADLIRGNDGNDSLMGDAGNDTLEGGNGADTLSGGAGTDSIDGGADSDRVAEVINGNATIVGTLLSSASTGNELLANIERITLSGNSSNNFFDARQAAVRVVLLGDAGNDTLFGSALADTIQGGEGDDVILGGAGNDNLDGGNGNDVHYEKANANFQVIGSQVSSSAIGTDTATSFEGVAIVGGAGANLIDASQATVRVSLLGGAGNDTLLGGSQNDVISGGSRNDTPGTGADGADSINGGLGSDTIESDAADTIVVDVNDQQMADVFGLLPDWLDQ